MKISTSRNPVELVERYLQAVRFWMPKSQQDLIAELSDDLHSQIESKEDELGRSLDEAEVSALLKRCGRPITVAARLRPQRYLIGPTLFPVYRSVLKMTLLWMLLPIFIFIVGPVYLANAGGNLGLALARTTGNLCFAAFMAAGIITIIFAALEHTQAQLGLVDNWNPLTLPPMQKQERKAPLLHTVCELAFGWFGLIWLLLVPHYPVLILGPAAAFLRAAPIWHLFYPPLLFLACIGLARSGTMLAKPEWTAFPLWSKLLQTVLTLIVVSFMIVASHLTTRGDWRPFFVVADGLRDSAQSTHVAAIVNLSVVICMGSVWFGLCIAAIVQILQLLRHLGKRLWCAHQPASLA